MKLLGIVTSIAVLGALALPIEARDGRGGGGHGGGGFHATGGGRSFSGPRGGQVRSFSGPRGGTGMAFAGPRGGRGVAFAGPRGGRGVAFAGPRGGRGVAFAGPRGGRGVAFAGPRGGRGVAIAGPRGGQRVAIAGPRGGRFVGTNRLPAVGERSFRGADWGRRHGWTHHGGHWFHNNRRTNIVFVPGYYPWAYSGWGDYYGDLGYWDGGYYGDVYGAPVVSLPAVGESTVVDVQRELRAAGFYSGPIDGIIGPGTRAAIRAYQASNGLAITGQINSSLLGSLGL